MNSITIINHPSPQWPGGGRHLHVHETGRLLAITRADPLRAAAVRLVEEGLATPSTVMLLKDAAGIEPDQSATVKDALEMKGVENRGGA